MNICFNMIVSLEHIHIIPLSGRIGMWWPTVQKIPGSLARLAFVACKWGSGKAFYSSRPGSAWDFTHVRLIFMNDSFIKCVSSILKY